MDSLLLLYLHTVNLPAMVHQQPYRTIREYYRLPQSDWGAALGVSPAAISQWETGSRAVPPWANAIYNRLQKPIAKGDLHELDRLRGEILKAAEETHRAQKKKSEDLLVAGAVGLGIGLLLAALFKE